MADWKEEYLNELYRTSGRKYELIQHGGWYEVRLEGGCSDPSRFRKKQIVSFTITLKGRSTSKSLTRDSNPL
jgi:hypothetical protein